MTVESEFRSPAATLPGSRSETKRSRPIRAQIVDYLATHGASKVFDISNGIGSSRDCVRYHLAALETASVVSSDISPGSRGRFTPFYALTANRAR